MDVLTNSTTNSASLLKENSSAERIGMLILEELRLMRKDINEGVSKLELKIEALSSSNQLMFSKDYVAGDSIEEETEPENHFASFLPPENMMDSASVDKEDLKPSNSAFGNNIDDLCEKMRIKQEINAVEQNVCSSLELFSRTLKNNTSNDTDGSMVTGFPQPSSQLPAITEPHVEELSKSAMTVTSRASPGSFTDKYKLNHNCKICMKSHSSSHKLKRHYIEVHDHVNKNICSFCGRSCYNATDLKVHIRTHTGEKPYKCSICDKAFADKSNYTRHRRMRKDLTCEICGKLLCTKLQFYQHNLTHR